MRKIDLLIFDMDGLMFETGRLAYYAYLKSAKIHNFEMMPAVYYYLTGRTETGIIDGMKELYGESRDVELWRQTINEYKNKKLAKEQRVYKKKGLVELIDFAKETNLKIAIASSTARETINYYLEIEQLVGKFDFIVSGDMIKKGKPDPEIFLTACKALSINPKNSIVLEDSVVGIEGANSAEIPSFLIEDDIMDMPNYSGKTKLKKQLPKIQSHREQADYFFRDLIEVKKFIKAQELFLS